MPINLPTPKAVTPTPNVRHREFDKCGAILAGGQIWTYEANSTTPKVTYKDPYGITPNTNPVLLDANGEADIFLNGTYRFVVKDKKGVVQKDVPRIGSWYSGDLDDQLKNMNELLETSAQTLMQPLADAINAAAAAGAGANGWSDLLIQTEDGGNQRNVNAQTVKFVDSIAELTAIKNPKDGQVVYVKSYHAGLNRGGDFFEYKSSRQLENDGGNIIDGWERKVSPTYLNLENYGATGLGLQTYDDQTALKRIEAVVKKSSAKAFVIHAPDGDYTVGKQTFTSGVSFTYENGLDISFNAMTEKYILLQCDNARFKMRNDMFYGVFDKTTKAPFATEMPFYPNTTSWVRDKDKVSIAELGFMLNFDNIKGLVTTGKLSTDGNMSSMTIGGQYGDSGWQLVSYGFRVARVERFDISNIDTFNHCLDGLYVAGVNSTSTPDLFNSNYKGVVRNVTSTRNGRQGCSFAGGQNISWYDCNFADTALASFKVRSMPMSCFDIEAEVYPIRNTRFYNCFFGDAPTTSLVADSGNTQNVHFYSCRFINSLGVVAWVRKPQFKFFNCYFNGYMEGQYKAATHENRTVYDSCTFTDDPTENPNYLDKGRTLIDASNANPIFNNCTINLYKSGLPVSTGVSAGLIPEFNNLLVNLYGTNRYSVMFGNITMRIRDYRAVKDQWNPTIYSRVNSVCVIENLSGEENKLSPAGFGGLIKVSTEILPVNVAYEKPAGVAVANATGTDDTAIKLNALIKSLKDSKQIL